MKIGNYKREFDQYLLTKKQNNYFPKNLPRMINKNKMVVPKKDFSISFHPNPKILSSAKKVMFHNQNLDELAYVYKGRCTNYFEIITSLR